MSYRHYPDAPNYHPGTRIPIDEDCPYPEDYDPCAEGQCSHPSHCDQCGAGLPTDEGGWCLDCEIRYAATHQLGCDAFPSILQSEEQRRK